MNFDKIEKLIELMRKHGLVELKVEDGDAKYSLKSREAASMPPQGMMPSYYPPMGPPPNMTSAGFAPAGAASDAGGQPAAGASQAAQPVTGKTIKSPFVGTFYRSSQPGADAFCSVGSRVHKGDTLCIIEAMKLMNEIEAEFDGVVREILVDNGEPVEFDQPLFIIE